VSAESSGPRGSKPKMGRALCLAIGPLIRAIVTPRRAVRAVARVGARVLPGSKPRVPPLREDRVPASVA